MKKGKKYNESLKLVEKNKLYTKEEAIQLVKKISKANFDETIEIALKLNIDPKKVDQQLRGAIVLPKGTGSTKKILVIAKGEHANLAKEIGADYVGDEEILTKIEKENWFDFDIIIATPDMMPLIARYGKILGPKGLMPNPKIGTVTTDVQKAIQDVKKGQVNYRTDNYGNIHAIIGKVSFTEQDLLFNMEEFVSCIIRNKPQTVKGKFIQGIAISATMSPGIKIEPNSFDI